MRTSRGLAALLVAPAVVLAGCGPSGPTVEQWTDSMCAAVLPFVRTAVDAPAETPDPARAAAAGPLRLPDPHHPGRRRRAGRPGPARPGPRRRRRGPLRAAPGRTRRDPLGVLRGALAGRRHQPGRPGRGAARPACRAGAARPPRRDHRALDEVTGNPAIASAFRASTACTDLTRTAEQARPTPPPGGPADARTGQPGRAEAADPRRRPTVDHCPCPGPPRAPTLEPDDGHPPPGAHRPGPAPHPARRAPGRRLRVERGRHPRGGPGPPTDRGRRRRPGRLGRQGLWRDPGLLPAAQHPAELRRRRPRRDQDAPVGVPRQGGGRHRHRQEAAGRGRAVPGERRRRVGRRGPRHARPVRHDDRPGQEGRRRHRPERRPGFKGKLDGAQQKLRTISGAQGWTRSGPPRGWTRRSRPHRSASHSRRSTAPPDPVRPPSGTPRWARSNMRSMLRGCRRCRCSPRRPGRPG